MGYIVLQFKVTCCLWDFAPYITEDNSPLPSRVVRALHPPVPSQAQKGTSLCHPDQLDKQKMEKEEKRGTPGTYFEQLGLIRLKA